ncbi:MAG: hypothetical protein NTW19_25355 [Planctomycetota bacterium]|nr:hypothetical protein [Planctomycetota bacterium]
MTDASTNLPPELESRPRRVRWVHTRDFWGGLGARIFILPHTLIGIGAAAMLIAYVAWMLFAPVVPAQAVGVWSTASKGGRTHYAAFDYVVDGQTLHDKSDISPAEFQGLAAAGLPVGQAVQPVPNGLSAPMQVRTLGLGSLRSTKAVSSSRNGWGQVGFLALWATFWNSVMCVFAYKMYVEPWRRGRLYRVGLPAPGVIEAKHVHRGKSVSYSVEYMFVALDGREIKAKHEVAQWAYDRAEPGQAVTVLHFEGKTKPSVVYEYGGRRCE